MTRHAFGVGRGPAAPADLVLIRLWVGLRAVVRFGRPEVSCGIHHRTEIGPGPFSPLRATRVAYDPYECFSQQPGLSERNDLSPGLSDGAGVRCRSYCFRTMPALEEITYEAGRAALADQESLVSGIRQRTGTLLAAHALVASFLGATTVRAQGLHALGWLAMAALVLGLVAAATLLSPWRLKFAIDARELYKDLYPQAAAEAETEALGWLATAGYSYQALREENAPKVRRMSQLSGVLGVLMVVQTLAWLAALAVD
jgi:hypothetical protein